MWPTAAFAYSFTMPREGKGGPHSNKLWTASMPPSAATTVPLAVASGGPPTGVAEAPPLDR